MDNNLDNFFNKKLNDFDTPSGGWDDLGDEPWANAQAELPTLETSIWTNTMSILAGSLAVGLIVSLAYIFYLQNTIHQLKETTIQPTTIQQKDASSDIINSINPKNENENEISTGVENTSLLTENQIDKNTIHPQKEHSILENGKTIFNHKGIANIQSHTVSTLNEQNSLQTAGLTSQASSSNSLHEKSAGEDGVNEIVPSKEPIDIPLLDLIASKELSTPPTPLKELDITFKKMPNSQNKWSIGYEMGLTEYHFSSKKDIDRQHGRDHNREDFFMTTHGLTLGYQLNKHWKLVSGIRTGHSEHKPSSDLEITYDKDDEYIQSNGQIAYDVTIESTTPYSESTTLATLTFPGGNGLVDGDLLYTTFSEQQSLESWQIPLGIEYQFGRNKWQWFGQFGGQYNHFELTDYNSSTKINTQGERIVIGNIQTDLEQPSHQFMSIFGGMGVHYQLTQKWQANAALIYNLNLIHSHDFNRHKTTDQSFRLGLSYQF